MSWLVSAVLTTLASTLILCLAYGYLYIRQRERSVRVWLTSWGIIAFQRALMLLMALGYNSDYIYALVQIAALVAGILFFWATFLFLGQGTPQLKQRLLITDIIGVVLLAIAAVLRLPRNYLAIPVSIFVAAIYIWTGWAMLRHQRLYALGRQTIGIALIIWGIHKADYPFIGNSSVLAPWGQLLTAVLMNLVAIGMMMLYFDEVNKRLIASSEKYHRLFDNANDAILVYELENNYPGRFLEVNDIACARFGYTNEEFLKMSRPQIQPPDEINKLPLLLKDLQRSGYSLFEETLLTRDGRRFPAEVSANVFELDHRQVVLIVVRDVTERKLAEYNLSQAEERYRNLLEQVPAIVYTATADEKILTRFISPQVEGLLGYTPAELTDRPELWQQLIYPEDHQKLLKNFSEPLENGQAISAEYRIRAKDGRTVWVRDDATVIRSQDAQEPGLLQGFVLDINEQKRLEAELLQAQRLESVGRLAGGIAHDFNNLLTAITGYAEFAREAIPTGDQAHEDIAELLNVVERARNLTRQLLAFSRRQILEMRSTDLNELMTNLSKMLRRLIGEDIEFVLLPGEALWPVLADASQLEQMLLNLTVNARDAMPDGGKLTLETTNVSVTTVTDSETKTPLPPGDYALLSVRDSGVGMNSEVKQHLFEPFYSTKNMDKNFGLGLATVYGIIKQHQGFIYVDSEPGQGTNFRIYLPRLAEGKTQEIQPVTKEALPGGEETILMVEDEPAVRQVNERALRRLGYKVLTASNGSEALRLAQLHGENIDLLMTDLVMPAMSGDKLAEEMSRLYPNLHVLFVSGYTENLALGQAIRDGQAIFMQKPFTSFILAHKVREALGTNPRI